VSTVGQRDYPAWFIQQCCGFGSYRPVRGDVGAAHLLLDSRARRIKNRSGIVTGWNIWVSICFIARG